MLNKIARTAALGAALVLTATVPALAGEEKMDRLLTEGGCCYDPPPYFDCTYPYPKRATELARDRIVGPAEKVCWGAQLYFGGQHMWWGACKVETDSAVVVEAWWLPGQPGYQFGGWDSNGYFEYRGLHRVSPCPRSPDGTLT
jgi:hypothetical protein